MGFKICCVCRIQGHLGVSYVDKIKKHKWLRPQRLSESRVCAQRCLECLDATRRANSLVPTAYTLETLR